MQTIYRPGQWSLVVIPGALVALAPDARAELVEALWARLRAERTLATVVDVITESVGGSFATMPSFAAAVLEGVNVRVAVRGSAIAQITAADGPETVSGENVTTWSERFVPGAGRIVLRLADADGPGELPILGGIVRAAEVTADIEPGDGADPLAVADDGHIARADVPPAYEPASVALAAPVPSVAIAESADDDRSIEADAIVDAAAEGPVVEEPAAEEASGEEPAPEESAAGEPAADAENASDEPAEEADSSHAEHDAVSDETLIPVEQTFGSDLDEFEQLFGDTVHSVPSAAPSAAPPAPPVPLDDDHDGATISVAESRALRREAPQAAPDAPTAIIPTVGTGRVRVSTGQVVTLDRTVVIGRRPRAPRASGANLPHLIAVESPQQDISRSHLEIRPEGDTVVVVDLHTTNGSTLLRPGTDPMRLHPGEQTLVLSGDVIDLGDGVTVVFEDLP